jgi:hypothetical protein
MNIAKWDFRSEVFNHLSVLGDCQTGFLQVFQYGRTKHLSGLSILMITAWMNSEVKLETGDWNL